jgi:hypothetical protein
MLEGMKKQIASWGGVDKVVVLGLGQSQSLIVGDLFLEKEHTSWFFQITIWCCSFLNSFRKFDHVKIGLIRSVGVSWAIFDILVSRETINNLFNGKKLFPAFVISQIINKG